MGNPVVHWELWSENPEGASAFYSQVFGWKVQSMPEMSYHIVDTGGEGGINGGIFKPHVGEWPGKLTFYIAVDDLDSYGAKVEAAGGKIIVSKQEVPGMGAFSLFQDPDKRVLGMWQTTPKT